MAWITAGPFALSSISVSTALGQRSRSLRTSSTVWGKSQWPRAWRWRSPTAFRRLS